MNSHIQSSGRSRPESWGQTTFQLLRFALPTFVLMALGSGVLLLELWLISRLGVEPLAGFTLCLPLAFLMTTMSAGGFGGGVTSSVARSQSSLFERGRLIRTAISLSLMIGSAFALLLAVSPQFVLGRMSDSAQTLAEASAFARIFFMGAPVLWLANTLASAHRGLGRPETPAKIGALSAVIQVALSYPMILGVGTFEGFGIRGAAIVPIVGYVVQVILQLIVLARALGGWRAVLPQRLLQLRHVVDILWVGLPSSINTLTVALASIQLTAIAAGLGIEQLAGFGVSTRLESLVMPVMFSIGTSLVALIGIAWGQGNYEQARRLLVVGAVLSFSLTSIVGLGMAFAPLSVLEHFSDSTEIALAARTYLQIVGPAIGLLGLGLAFSFSCQGIKRPLPALLASLARLSLVSLVATYFRPQSLEELGWLTVGSLIVFVLILISGAGPLSPFRRISSTQVQMHLNRT